MSERPAVLITGSNGGVGSALCAACSAAGYLVVATDRIPRQTPGADSFLAVELDELVANDAALEAFGHRVLDVIDRQGGKLFALINNAAVQLVGELGSLSVHDFEQSHRVNVAAPFALAKLFEQQLRESAGSIVNIGSIHARLSKSGFCAYSASKAGLSGLTRALALDLAGAVTVNTIAPAAVDTPMLRAGFEGNPDLLDSLGRHHPAGRIGKPEEVAELAVFLLSPAARFITGAELSLDGGVGVRLHDPA